MFLVTGSRRLSLGSVVKWNRKNKKTNESSSNKSIKSPEQTELATRNVVYSALVMTEFLQELAAISQEQALMSLNRLVCHSPSHAL